MNRPESVRLAAYEEALRAMPELRRQGYALLLETVPHRNARLHEGLVRALQAGWPALSHPQIGKLIGIEQSTVARIAKRNRRAGRVVFLKG